MRLQKYQAALDDVKHLLPMLDCFGWIPVALEDLAELMPNGRGIFDAN